MRRRRPEGTGSPSGIGTFRTGLGAVRLNVMGEVAVRREATVLIGAEDGDSVYRGEGDYVLSDLFDGPLEIANMNGSLVGGPGRRVRRRHPCWSSGPGAPPTNERASELQVPPVGEHIGSRSAEGVEELTGGQRSIAQAEGFGGSDPDH